MILMNSQIRGYIGQGPERPLVQELCPFGTGVHLSPSTWLHSPLWRLCRLHPFGVLWWLYCIGDRLNNCSLTIDSTFSSPDPLILKVSEAPLISWGKTGRRRRWQAKPQSAQSPFPTAGAQPKAVPLGRGEASTLEGAQTNN